MDEAKRIGGEEGVSYLMQQGYGYFRVGDKIMNAEELGNYSLGVIATKKGHSRQEGYNAANADEGLQWLKNFGNEDTDESYFRAMEDGIRAQNAEKAKGAFWSPLGYMMTEAEQIKTSGRGRTDDDRPYIDVSLNSPWYRGGN